jgi:dUTP pyrophosphatase
LVSTGLYISLPENTCGRIVQKRRLEWDNDITIGGGIIDTNSKDPIIIIIFNNSDEEFPIRSGDCIAQLIIQEIVILHVQEIPDVQEIADVQEIFVDVKMDKHTLEKPVLIRHGPVRF